MTKDLCVKSAMDDHKHSSPMPVIGLYIAGATLVCFLSMVYDILQGIRLRKPWLPCRFFKLNSLTLTLLSIATKLPVDLTTSMPSAHDQLSKLSGTAFICISMGFFMPSLGIMSDKEGLANMASLTILVIAVVVNVCIQMTTGVIFSFIVEHIIILICMLLLLVILWSSMSINFEATVITDRTRELLLKGASPEQSSESSLIQRLKLCYVHSYSSNPQLILLQSSYCVIIGILCTLSSVVLSEAVFRSVALKEFKFCKEVSDYRWSMKMVVLIQILTVLVGSVATIFRWLAFVGHMDATELSADDIVFWRTLSFEMQTVFLHYLAFRFSKISFMKMFRLLEFLVIVVVILMQLVFYTVDTLIVFLSIMVIKVFESSIELAKIFMYKHRDGGTINSMTKEFQDVVYSVAEWLKEWILSIGVADMERWMKVNEKRDSPEHLIQLLLKTPPSQQSLVNDIQLMGQGHRYDEDMFGNYNYRVSCLSIVVLVLVATISTPSSLSGSLIHILDEVFEIIYFIDKKINAVSLGNKVTSMLANDVWMDKEIIIRWIQKKIMKHSQKENSNMVSNGVSQPQTDLDRALEIINKLRSYNFEFIDPEVMIITNFIKNQNSSSVEELYNHIEQVLVDMLQSFLINLPCAIVNDIVESPAEECEERVRLGMKFLCKLELLDDKVQWSFPNGSNISSLLTTRASTTDTHHNTQMERVDATVALRVNEDETDATVALHVNEEETDDETIQEIA